MPIGTLTRNTQRQPVMPRIVVLAGEEAAGDRAEHARGGEDRHEVAGVLGPLARRDDVADDREHQREQAAGAEPLERAERRQLYIDVANEQAAEPTMKTVIANMNSFLRP